LSAPPPRRRPHPVSPHHRPPSRSCTSSPLPRRSGWSQSLYNGRPPSSMANPVILQFSKGAKDCILVCPWLRVLTRLGKETKDSMWNTRCAALGAPVMVFHRVQRTWRAGPMKIVGPFVIPDSHLLQFNRKDLLLKFFIHVHIFCTQG
jgi:hypothetical protein